MRILAFDTSGNACSAALWRDGAVVAHRLEAMERGHTEALVPMILEVLHEAECGFAALDWLAVTVGPGSFTGIRAGLATAHGLALARALPALGIDNFATALRRMERARPGAATAPAPASDRGLRVIALDSRRREIYLRIFSALGEPLGEPAVVAADDIAALVGDQPVLLGGTAAPDVEGALRQAGIEVTVAWDRAAPNATDVAEIAAERIAARAPGDDLPRPAPLYLHPPYAVAPAAGGRLRP